MGFDFVWVLDEWFQHYRFQKQVSTPPQKCVFRDPPINELIKYRYGPGSLLRKKRKLG
jgi:hypothetical protein